MGSMHKEDRNTRLINYLPLSGGMATKVIKCAHVSGVLHQKDSRIAPEMVSKAFMITIALLHIRLNTNQQIKPLHICF